MMNSNQKNAQYVFLFILLLSMHTASAQLHKFAFMKKRGSYLTFSTAAQSIFKNNCSAVATVQHRNSSGAAANVTSNLTVNLTTPDSVVFYSDVGCINPISSVVIASGSSTASFYFVSTANGSPQINAEATNYNLISQVETINTNPYVWSGGGADANWATALNWSGGAVPGSTNIALFDSTCTVNCSPTIALNTTVGGVRIETGYSGTITQEATRTLTVNSRGWIQKAGTFQGADATITIGAIFNQTGGVFASTSGNLITKSHVYQTGGTFTHRSGHFVWNTSCCSTWDLQLLSPLNHLSFNEINAAINVINTVTVLGNLVFNDGNSSGGSLSGTGTLEVWGDVTITNFSAGSGGLIKLVGTSQTITGTADKTISNLEIASQGTVTLAGDIEVEGNFTHTSGTIIPGTSTLRFPKQRSRTITANNTNINNLQLNAYNSTLTLNGTMNVGGALTLDNGGNSDPISLAGGGIINLSGNLNIVSWNNKYSDDNYTVNLVGDNTRTQTITGTSGAYINNLAINSASAINLVGNIDVVRNYTYIASGAFNAGTSTLSFKANSGATTITPGTATYKNVTFSNKATNSNNTYTISGTMDISGNLVLDQTNLGNVLNSGTLVVGGNISLNYFNGGTTALTLNGTGAQTISRTGGTFPRGNISIAKASGSIELASAISWNGTGQGTTVAAGALNIINMNNYALTLTSLNLNGNTVTKGGGALTVGGVVAGTGPLYSGTVDP